MNTQNLSKFQKFEVKRIFRNEIKNAPYNPRGITKESYNELKHNLKKIGLIETLVWNQLTGNLVSGHQRLKILDELEKRDDYEIDVACVSFSEKTEKEQNIFMNNQNVQGYYELDLLKNILPDIELRNAGFTEAEINVLGIELDLDKQDFSSMDDVIGEFERIRAENKQKKQETAQPIGQPEEKNIDWKDVKKTIKSNQKKEAEADIKETYTVLTFDNYQNKAAFMERFGFKPDDRYVKGEILTNLINDIKG